jgi:hypothetical protein
MTKTLALYIKKDLSIKQVYLRDIFKKASTSDSTSIIVESPDPFSPAFFCYEDSRRTQKRTLLIQNQQMEISKWNTPLIICTVKVKKAIKIKYL